MRFPFDLQVNKVCEFYFKNEIITLIIHSWLMILIFECLYMITGDPLHVGMDLTIASFDAISEVNMVSMLKVVI